MKIKTAWLSELRGSLGRPFQGGMSCFRTDKYGNIVGLKKPVPTGLFTKKRPLYQHQLRYWSLHWNFLTPGQKQTYQDLGDAENITGYNYFMKSFYDTAALRMAPTDNHFTYERYPDTWFHPFPFLPLNNDPGHLSWIYVDFPFEKISKNLVITKAELWLFYDEDAVQSSEGIRVDCHKITEDWSMYTITWNNAPAVAGTETDHTNMPAEGEWFYFDVTADLNNLISTGDIFWGWRTKFHTPADPEVYQPDIRSAKPWNDDNWPYLKLIL